MIKRPRKRGRRLSEAERDFNEFKTAKPRAAHMSFASVMPPEQEAAFIAVISFLAFADIRLDGKLRANPFFAEEGHALAKILATLRTLEPLATEDSSHCWRTIYRADLGGPLSWHVSSYQGWPSPDKLEPGVPFWQQKKVAKTYLRLGLQGGSVLRYGNPPQKASGRVVVHRRLEWTAGDGHPQQIEVERLLGELAE